MAEYPITAPSTYIPAQTSPTFTVIVPTHNRAELLKQAIASVLEQTFGDFELLVVDDHSSDDTQAVVNAFDDPRVKLIVNDRRPGGAGARNAGIFRARGEWIAFLDDDDIWLPEKLERQYARAQEVADAVSLIYSGVYKCSPDLTRILSTSQPSKEGWMLNELLSGNSIGTYSSVIIRSSTLRLIGGLDESFPAMQDAELYIRAAMVAQMAYVVEPLVLYRSNMNGNISSNIESKLAAALMIRDKFWHLISQDVRLRHRAASRIFIFAWRSRSYSLMYRALPWTLVGIFRDPQNVIWVLRMMWASLKGNW